MLIVMACSNKIEPRLEDWLSKDPNPILSSVLQEPNKYKYQIRYTRILRDGDRISLKSEDISVDSSTYFYPASTVKMPIAALALEWIDSKPNLKPETIIHHMAARPSQSIATTDSCTYQDQPTIKGYVQEIFAISDNNAYNRLFELLGAEHINDRLFQIGAFTNGRIVSRVGVSGFDTLENQYVNPIAFLNSNLDTIHLLPNRKSRHLYDKSIPSNCIQGQGYIDNDGQLVKAAFDMCNKNYVSIQDLERILMRIIIPEYFSEQERFAISDSSRILLLDAMKSIPRGMDCYRANEEYTDNFCKFIMQGISPVIPNHIEIYNKIGLAYGYMTDCAYIRDTQNDIEFFITASLSVNDNEIYNDGKYQYETIGLPFMDALGKAIHEYSLQQ